jgi:hypothetical protein
MKIRPVGAELFHANRRTDRYEEANGRFSHFLPTHLKRERTAAFAWQQWLRERATLYYAHFYLAEIITDG